MYFSRLKIMVGLASNFYPRKGFALVLYFFVLLS